MLNATITAASRFGPLAAWMDRLNVEEQTLVWIDADLPY